MEIDFFADSLRFFFCLYKSIKFKCFMNYEKCSTRNGSSQRSNKSIRNKFSQMNVDGKKWFDDRFLNIKWTFTVNFAEATISIKQMHPSVSHHRRCHRIEEWIIVIDLIFFKRLVKLSQQTRNDSQAFVFGIMFRMKRKKIQSPTCWVNEPNNKGSEAAARSEHFSLAISFYPHFRIFSFILYDRRICSNSSRIEFYALNLSNGGKTTE